MNTATTYPVSASRSEAILAKSIQTTIEKAKTLWRDGYTARPTHRMFVYDVISPEKKVYTVDVKGETCTCSMFARGEVCKHLLATRHKVITAIAFLTPDTNPVLPEPSPMFPQIVPTSPEPKNVHPAYLKAEFWGEDHERPIVYRVVSKITGKESRLFYVAANAHEWAEERDIRIEETRDVDMRGFN